uniref:Sialidase domain-containing protein n=1 Tax=Coccolithus braarudii TaxID=221442 RepID=A0A7S0LNW1_9EUKA|mmetsp:Transcript_50578/g.107996  ORF Transcript_50578/g.107996 Transcript_50578/m.107996 type:complete len:373 (+) Transcript_50578:16-1134(+)
MALFVVVLAAVAAAAVRAGAPVIPPLSPGCLPAVDGQQDLWCPGAEGAGAKNPLDSTYKCYKIPSLVRTWNGTVLAFIEARKLNCGDQGYVDLRMRRSLDGGKTWLPSQMIHGESTTSSHVTIGDACPTWDAARGMVHLVFTRNNADVFYTRSTDEGATWAPPRNISGMVDGHRGPGNFIGTGHAGGLQLRRTGRLLVPMHGPCHMIYSDDGGETWAKAPGAMSNGGECQVAEIRPGLLIVSGRNDGTGYTEIAYSTDDGMTWNTSTPNHDLRSPVGGCEASIVQHPNGMLYHSAPDSLLLRSKMVVKVSADQGHTWRNHRHVWDKAAGYSALSVLGNDTDVDAPLGLLYDRDDRPHIIFEAHGITFTSFPP